MAHRALEQVDPELKIEYTTPNDHAPELIVPLVGQTTICILNELLTLLPGEGRVISFQCSTAGVSLHEELKISYSSVAIRMTVIGSFVDWDIEFDHSKRPTIADDEAVAAIMAGRVSAAISSVINSHVGVVDGGSH